MAQAREPSSVSLAESSDEFRTLTSLLHHDRPTVEEAVQQMCDSAIAQIPVDESAAIELDYRISLAVLELAQRYDAPKTTKLVEFMYHLHKRAAVDPGTGQPLLHEGRRLWTDLPWFGVCQLEAWYETGGWRDGDVFDVHMHPECRRRWVNLNAFLAQLTQAADIGYKASKHAGGPATLAFGCAMDASSMMPRTVRLAFECGNLEARSGGRSAMSAEVLDMPVVWAACEWFLHAADRLWAHVEEGLVWEEGPSVAAGSAYASRGWRGFERERWDVWEQWLRDLEWLSRREAREDSEGGLRVGRALQRMLDAKAKAFTAQDGSE